MLTLRALKNKQVQMKTHRFIKLSILVLLSFLAGRYSYNWTESSIDTSQQVQVDVIEYPKSKLNNNQGSNSLTLARTQTFIEPQVLESNVDVPAMHPSRASKVLDDNKVRNLIPSGESNNEYLSQLAYQSNVLYSSLDVQDRLASIDILTDILASEEVAIGLGDNEPIVRIKAIEGLKQIASDNAIRYIGQSLFTTNTLETKLAAISALSELSYHPNASQFLRYTSQKDENEDVRVASLKALGEYSVDD